MKPYVTSLKAGNRDLSRSYSVATSRIHEVITELYEGLHDDEGTPMSDVQDVYEMIRSVRQLINIEFDLAVSAAKEYNETKWEE